MFDLSTLEPFGLLTMAGGLFYSISILTLETAETRFRGHFIVLTLVLFVALLVLSVFKYFTCRFRCRQMDELLQAMRIQ